MLMTHVSDIPTSWDRLPPCARDILLVGILFINLPAVYGGIHLSAWKFRFPSKTEQLLWRIACFAIIGAIPITCFSTVILLVLLDEDNMDRIPFGDFGESLRDILIWSLVIALSVLYILSRFYIVIEAFVSLRHVPIGVFAAVPWVEAMPHV